MRDRMGNVNSFRLLVSWRYSSKLNNIRPSVLGIDNPDAFEPTRQSLIRGSSSARTGLISCIARSGLVPVCCETFMVYLRNRLNYMHTVYLVLD